MKLLSVMGILALTAISCMGIRGGKVVQNLITIAKVSGLAAIILLLTVKMG
jgi:amino acid transporter